MRKYCLAALFILTAFVIKAQDLNCNVQVLTPKIQSSDKRIYETMETAIFEFMNNRKWTNDVILANERIECNFIINITEKLSVDEFKGNLQIQSSRPVYGTSYKSTLFNFNDPDFTFKYVENQTLEYSENTNQSNLTSMLAFYAYIILGLDYDTFSLQGGTAYFQKAQAIVNNSQNFNDKGWKAFENTRNRYWLAENYLNQTFKPLRESLYKYHRKGLDVMSKDIEGGRREIASCLPLLQKIYKEKPNSICMQVFFIAKSDELVSIFSKATPSEKPKIIATLSEIDVSNVSKYQQILKN